MLRLWVTVRFYICGLLTLEEDKKIEMTNIKFLTVLPTAHFRVSLCPCVKVSLCKILLLKICFIILSFSHKSNSSPCEKFFLRTCFEAEVKATQKCPTDSLF